MAEDPHRQVRSLTDLPSEILTQVLAHLIPNPWSISITSNGLGAGPPIIFDNNVRWLYHVSHQFRHLVDKLEKSTFMRTCSFHTSKTTWRTICKLRRLSPTRMGWYFDHVEKLVFCEPPLFTSRIPWNLLPGLKVVVLDYRGRNVSFRTAGTLRELLEGSGCGADVEAETTGRGGLDEVIVRFARDTERFDWGVVEDAWPLRGGSDGNVGVAGDVVAHYGADGRDVDGMEVNPGCVECGKGPAEDELEVRRIEVHVIKKMVVYNDRAISMSDWAPATTSDRFEVTVTAKYRGRLMTVEIQGEKISTRDVLMIEPTVIWRAEYGYRRKQQVRDIPQPLKEKGVIDLNRLRQI